MKNWHILTFLLLLCDCMPLKLTKKVKVIDGQVQGYTESRSNERKSIFSLFANVFVINVLCRWYAFDWKAFLFFSILYHNFFLIRWISWIQLEPASHDCRIVKVFLWLSLTVCSFGIMVSMPDCWSVVWRLNSQGLVLNITVFFCLLISWIRWIFWFKIEKMQMNHIAFCSRKISPYIY